MGCATACRYPVGYFDDPGANSDEDLEIERNDVRDLLRAVSDPGSSSEPISMALRLLLKLLQACEHSVLSSRDRHQLFDETVIHAFSALGRCCRCALSEIVRHDLTVLLLT